MILKLVSLGSLLLLATDLVKRFRMFDAFVGTTTLTEEEI